MRYGQIYNQVCPQLLGLCFGMWTCSVRGSVRMSESVYSLVLDNTAHPPKCTGFYLYQLQVVVLGARPTVGPEMPDDYELLMRR
jgi:hypothetical protein